MIRELKRSYHRAMHKSHAPAILWDHCLQLMAEIRRHTTLNLFSLEGETPHTVLTGETPDISYLVEFEWYQFVGTQILDRKANRILTYGTLLDV